MMVAVTNCWRSDANPRRHRRDADRAGDGGAIANRRAHFDAVATRIHGAIGAAVDVVDGVVAVAAPAGAWRRSNWPPNRGSP